MHFENAKDIFLILVVILLFIHMIFSYINMYKTVKYFSGRYPDSVRYRIFKRNMSPYISLVKFFALLLEFVIVWYSFCFLQLSVPQDVDNSDISVRIENISDDLSKTSTELSNIQKELETRIELVENLKKEAEIAENTISLSDEQVKAIQAQLNHELENNSNEGLIQNILISTLFFILGILVPPITISIKNKIRKTTKSEEPDPTTKYSTLQIEQAIKLLDTIHQNNELQNK